MPTYDFICETCGTPGRAYRYDGKPPRFCNKDCRKYSKDYGGGKTVIWSITPEIHGMIEKVYKRDTGNGQVAALARRLNYPRWKITRYAINQGWTPRRKREPDWTDREIWILERNGHLSPEVIQRKLKTAGYPRSVIAVVLKRKRLKILQNLEGQSATSLALCLGVDGHFITRAIKAGKLRATRRGTHRTEAQGGDIFYIRDKAARDYILEWLNEIDIRKVEKEWFCDLLANGAQ